MLLGASLGSILALAAIDPTALQEHLDQVVPERLAEQGVPGVVISVVEGDRVLLARGWGLADVERGTFMDGEHTVVRVASVSKTFTATAVAQLEAQGKLQLDASVNEYLGGLAVPEPWGPITLRGLLSHSAGIINNNVGRVSRTPPEGDLASFLTSTMPPQLRPPAVAVVYSNHGNALAGLVVEQVTGERFADHVKAHLLDPLGMEHSSFDLRPDLEEALATGYTREDDGLVPYEYLYFKTIPASTLHTTAADMAHFMVMHLSEGRFGGQPVIVPEADRRMRQTVPAIHPALPAYHYAFAHGRTAGHATRSHGGSVPAFLSRMVLFDEHGVGVFVAQNSLGPSITGGLVDSIAERFLPEPPAFAVVPVGDGRPVDPDALTGRYRRLTKTDTPAFTRALAVLGTSPRVIALDDEGYLTVDGVRFLRTGDRVFEREREGKPPETVVFVADDEGRVRWVHRGFSAAERPPWHGARWLHLGVAGLVLLVLLGASARRRWRPAWAARLCLLGLLVPHLYVAWVDAGQVAYLRPLRFGMPGWIEALRWAIPASAGLAWALVLVSARARGSTAPARLRGALLVALMTSAVPLWEWYWSTPPPGLVEDG